MTSCWTLNRTVGIAIGGNASFEENSNVLMEYGHTKRDRRDERARKRRKVFIELHSKQLKVIVLGSESLGCFNGSWKQRRKEQQEKEKRCQIECACLITSKVSVFVCPS